MVVVLFLSLTLVVFRISARGSWWGLDLDAMTLSVYGSLIGYIFLRTLSLLHHPAPLLVSAASTTPTSAQWHRHLGHLSGSSISTLVGSGVLGPISGDAALHCTGCKLGKQLQLPFPLLILFHGALLISFTLMYGGLLPPL